MNSRSTTDLLKEARQLVVQEAEIKRRKQRLAKKLIEAARELGGADLLDEEVAQAPKKKPHARRRRRHPAVATVSSRGSGTALSGASWTATMLGIIEEADRGLTYAELKESVAKTPLVDRLRYSDKSFYGGIGKLEERKLAVRHKGRIFSNRAYERFQRDLAAGLVQDEEPPRTNPAHDSPAKSALLEFLEANPQGVTPAEIIAALSKKPGIDMSQKNNKVAVYNLISRLAKRKEVVKHDGRIKLRTRPNGAAHASMPASDNITGRPVGIEPVRS